MTVDSGDERNDEIDIEIISDPSTDDESPRVSTSRFLSACRREPVDATPIWLMRQAGRYMPQYRALREKYSILELIKNPDFASIITMQPVNAFDVDAAIIFADILTLLEGMGLSLEFVSGKGPIIDNPIRSAADVENLLVRAPEETLDFTLEAIRRTKQKLNGKIPLIGFSGAPFTLACYAIEGGSSKDFATAKQFMREQPDAWHKLMEKLTIAVGEYLQAQVDAGAEALQVFDTWAGMLEPDEYRALVKEHSKRAIDIAKKGNDVPLIHFGLGGDAFLTDMKEAGGDVIGIDAQTDIMSAWQRLGSNVGVQGNLDPKLLLGPADEMKRQAKQLIDSVDGKPGHIFNLGHGVIKETPPERVGELIDYVHEISRS